MHSVQVANPPALAHFAGQLTHARVVWFSNLPPSPGINATKCAKGNTCGCVCYYDNLTFVVAGGPPDGTGVNKTLVYRESDVRAVSGSDDAPTVLSCQIAGGVGRNTANFGGLANLLFLMRFDYAKNKICLDEYTPPPHDDDE